MQYDNVRTVIDGMTNIPHDVIENIIVHCQAGVSRSHAVALFAAKYFAKNEELYQTLLHQEGKVFGGNHYVYDKLITTFNEVENGSN